jgi:hypothetical protein
MIIPDNSFIEILKPYVANHLRVGIDKIFVDFRSVFFGDTGEIGVLATEDKKNIVVTEDSFNFVSIYDKETGDAEFEAEFGSYYFFLAYVGEKADFIVNDTYVNPFDNLTGGYSGFFFDKLRIKGGKPKLVYCLRFRRAV